MQTSEFTWLQWMTVYTISIYIKSSSHTVVLPRKNLKTINKRFDLVRSVQKQLQKPINIEEAVHSVLQKGYDPYIALCGWDTFLIWCYADGILSLYGVLQLKQFPYLVVCRGNTLCI